MYFRHGPEIWRDFPHLVAGALVLTGITPAVDLTARLEPFFARARARLAGSRESELPEVAAWRRAYAQMGLKPTQYRSASEALLRRFRRDGSLPQLHPLVDLCNAVSLAFALPVAVFDLAHVQGFLEVRRAHGSEQYEAFSGDVEAPEPGEVIFVDADDHAHARRWTFRQSRRSTVSMATQAALIVSEGLHEQAAEDLPALLDALEQEIRVAWQPPLNQAILSASAPTFEFM